MKILGILRLRAHQSNRAIAVSQRLAQEDRGWECSRDNGRDDSVSILMESGRGSQIFLLRWGEVVLKYLRVLFVVLK